jgi:DNA-3-methyladenine glycosylase
MIKRRSLTKRNVNHVTEGNKEVMRYNKLPRSFYARDPSQVAQSLLGKVLVHHTSKSVMKGKIVETEAYYGESDPTSRAFKGKTPLTSIMWGHPGIAFIYIVHANWLFNIIADRKDKPGAVLIRALEPLEGIELMKRNRRKGRLKESTSGPGKLTQAMGITKNEHGIDLTRSKSLFVVSGEGIGFNIIKSKRIGVSADLGIPLRFYIKGNRFVSK